MPTNDPEYMRNYQRKRRAKIADEQKLGEYIARNADQADVDAILDGVKDGNPLAWRKRRAAVDDIAKKAIEPEQVKVQPDGKLSKGLGQLPGQPTGWSAPVPKPTKTGSKK